MLAIELSMAGLLCAIVGIVLWFRRVHQVAIPDNRSLYLALWSMAGVLGVASFMVKSAALLSGIVGGLAILSGWGIIVLYVLAKQNAKEAIAVGAVIPEFSAVDYQGVAIGSADLLGTPTLLKFFRGHW